jgi:glyoxylate reductase
MKPKIIVTRRWPEQVEQVLQQHYDCEFNTGDSPFSSSQLQDALTRADAVLSTVTDKFDAAVLNVENCRTRVIANFGVGFSHIDINAAKAANITVTNTPDVLSDCTADLAMTLLLMAARRAGEGERELRADAWDGWRPTHLMGTKVTGKKLGIIGFGRIGRAMAHKAHHGFAMDILVHNRSEVPATSLAPVNAVRVPSIEALLAESDFVSLHCPGGDENKHLLNSQRITNMKPGSFLINTARGEVIDEDALINALQNGPIAGAGLDVFDNEPAIDSRFKTFSNAVLLPHLGSATTETRNDMGMRVVSNLNAFFAGDTPPDKVA